MDGQKNRKTDSCRVGFGDIVPVLLERPDGAVKQGLPRALAYQLASQMVVGTGKLQLATGAHPGAMKDAVCSPGGTTIRGVAELEKRAFRGTVISAVDAIEGN